MTKPIPMTIEKFFKLLPATKKFRPKLDSKGQIRYETNDCPITAVKRVVTGKGGLVSRPRRYFEFRTDSRRVGMGFGSGGNDVIINAADDRLRTPITTRLRRRMLRTLGLKSRYER